MKRIHLWLVMGVIIFGLVIWGVASHTRTSAKQGDVTVGAVLLLSGDNAQWGENARNAMELVREQINTNKGIGGKKLDIIYEDSRGEPKTAVSAFRKLTDVDRVPVVLGDMMSATTLAMAPLANSSKVVLIGIGSSAPAVTLAGPYVYRAWPSDVYEGTVFADYVAQQHYKRVAIAHLNNDYGNGLKEAFAKRFTKLGGRVVGEEAYSDADKDLRILATKVSASNPEAIYVVGYYEDSARVIKALREMGFRGKLLGTSSALSEKIFPIAGKAADGFTCALVNDFETADLTPAQKKFADQYKAKYGSDPDWAATTAADALLVAVQCMQKAQTGEEIKQVIDSQRKFTGVNQLTFDANGDVVDKPVTVKEVKAGKFVPVWKQKH